MRKKPYIFTTCLFHSAVSCECSCQLIPKVLILMGTVVSNPQFNPLLNSMEVWALVLSS
jgi:hypothetical protein